MAKLEPGKRQRSPWCYQYAAKFVCIQNNPQTSAGTNALVSGDYKTVVNVHNPNDHVVRLQSKVALGSKEFVSQFKGASLGPDEVRSYSCTDVNGHKFPDANLIHGATEGFLVIESTDSLDVVCVYTAGTLGGDVTSLEVENVREREIRRIDE